MEQFSFKEVNLTPPEGVRSALRRGLKLHEEGHSGDGLVPETVAWARRMSNGEAASEDKIRKMRAWHARHAVDKRPGWENPPTPGYVAFLLWGGAAGRAWSERKVAELDRSKEKAMSENAAAANNRRPARKMQFKSFGLEEVQIDEKGQFEGYASVFNNVDRHGDVVMPGAFRKTISENPSVPILWQHDQSKPIGVTMAIREDNNGLLVKGELNLDTQLGREAYSLLKQGALKGLSIGYQVIKDDLAGRVRQLKEVRLMEYSLVTFPANELAQVTSIKQMDNDMIMLLKEKIAEIHSYAMEAMGAVEALRGEEPGMMPEDEYEEDMECDMCGSPRHRKEALYCDMCGKPTRKPKEPQMKGDETGYSIPGDLFALLEEMRAALKEG
jgi:HK97 family phage prohead protease